MSMIMIVDKDAMTRNLLSAALGKEGYQTADFESGEDALYALSTTHPDLILLDNIIKDMDGLTFLKVLRRIPHHRHLPVILLTEVSNREHVVQAVKLGVDDYLLKTNFSYEEMLKRIYRHLNKGNQCPTNVRTVTAHAAGESLKSQVNAKEYSTSNQNSFSR